MSMRPGGRTVKEPRPAADQGTAGFTRPTTTQTPDALFDYWLTRLTGAELRVLLYAVRRIFGFGKESDEISLDQFVHGLKTADGRILDGGAGVSKTSLLRALPKLVERGLLLKTRHSDERLGDQVNTYRLHVRDERAAVGSGGGFRPPSTTPVPDDLFDVWLPRLSDAELRALLYIMRRTLGFGKAADIISPTQFLHGITTASGSVLDEGCGVSRKHLYAALRGLSEKGLIAVQRRVLPRQGNAASLFGLVFAGAVPVPIAEVDPRSLPLALAVDGSPASAVAPPVSTPCQAAVREDQTDTEGAPKRHQRSSVTRARGGPKRHQREDHDDANPNPRMVQGVVQNDAMVGPPRHLPGVQNDVKPLVSFWTTQQTVERQDTERQKTDQQETDLSKFSNDPATTVPVSGERATSSQRQLRLNATYQDLVAPLCDLARELGDEAAPRASISRAYNLLQATGCQPGQFLALLHEAKALTRTHQAGITKLRRDGGRLPRKNLMPYFFAILEGLLSSADHPPQPQVPRPPTPPSGLPPDHRPPGAQPGPEPGVEAAGTGSAADQATPVSYGHPVWDRTLAELQLVLTHENYDTWLARTRVVRVDGAVLHVGVPNVFHKEWLEHKLRGRIMATMQRLGYGDLDLVFEVIPMPTTVEAGNRSTGASAAYPAGVTLVPAD